MCTDKQQKYLYEHNHDVVKKNIIRCRQLGLCI